MSRKKLNLWLLIAVGVLLISAGWAIYSQPTNLGLDLKGGVQLVYEAQPTPQSKVTPDSINRAIDIMRSRVDALGVSEPEIQASGNNQITVSLPAVSNAEKAQKLVGSQAQLVFYDWEQNVVTPAGKLASEGLATKDPGAVKLMGYAGSPEGGQTLFKAATLASKQPVRGGADISRVGPQYWLFDKSGKKLVAGPDTSLKDLYSELPGKKRPAGSQLVELPQGTVLLMAVYKGKQLEQMQKDPAAAKWYVLRDKVAVFGKDIRDPKQDLDQNTGGTPDVAFKFTDRGQNAFQNTTREIAQRGQGLAAFYQGSRPVQHFAVALDQRLISVASVDYASLPDGIDGRNGAIITGGFTISTAQELAKLLQQGALPINLKPISQTQVSATLGKQALDQGLVAGLVGLAVVMLFLLAFYRVLGAIACVALIIYAIYLFAVVKVFHVTLTLPGLAGLILTIGVAADANIVIFERVKEEIRSGRSIPAGISQGYKKGLSAIIDANIVTLLTAFILFGFATAGVRGFAVMLGLGTILSLLTAVAATQAALGALSGTAFMSSPAALGASGKERSWKFDFMGSSRWFFSLSGVILLIGALAIGGKGLNLGMDFTSGTRIVTALEKPATEDQVRASLDSIGVNDASIQRVKNKDLGNNGFQISTSELDPAKVGQVNRVLEKDFTATSNFNSQSIGPTFGQTVADSAIKAIIISLIVISAYIALRFEWKFAVPVLIALMHDLLITAGVYSLTGREVTTATVAALLTILGYSLYDTIIVFDRVRENTPRMPRAAFSQIVNRSMSEVLTRSLATSLSTMLPILALLIFGGATLQDFAFALLVGVASGAYSSIFIASPVLTYWKEREPAYARRTARIKASAPDGKVPAYYGGPIESPAEPAARMPKNRLEAQEDLATGVAPVSPEEFAAMEADVKRELEEAAAEESNSEDFSHAPDAAEDDEVSAPTSGKSSKRGRKNGRRN
jgi:SecD/SecF fusion protein